jgi:hypothetical protein
VSIADAIAEAKKRNEQRLGETLNLERPSIPDGDRSHIERFKLFCRSNGVEASLQPTTVAAFLQAQSDRDLEPAMAAMQAWAAHFLLADPCSSIPVRTVLERRLRIELPRSWTTEDRLLFASLPPEVRGVIYKRETERDRSLRQKHNELAEEKKRLSTEAEKDFVSNDHH